MTKAVKKKIWYHPDLIETARYLRNNSTLTETILWQKLKNKQINGYDFHRQKPIDHYIVDFFCPKLMLAIEIDGSIHDTDESRLNDALRQEKIEEYGVQFLRFKNNDIKNNMENVMNRISEWIDLNGEIK